MPRFTYEVAGQTAVEEVPEQAADYFRSRPGYVEVIDEDAAAELTGAELDDTARAVAGITNPTHVHASEKRAAIVAATDPSRHAGDSEGE